ncbi:MAG: hypothetical protein L0Y57_07200, partial [Beijerinckiaceae bacterium]|nr:hypothetical protein [Beijerinckiaceae bacterium]
GAAGSARLCINSKHSAGKPLLALVNPNIFAVCAGGALVKLDGASPRQPRPRPSVEGTIGPPQSLAQARGPFHSRLSIAGLF